MGYFLPLLTEKSFRNQVEVVRNERRQSYETRPYGRSFLAGYEALYPEGHPARYLVIGRHEELEAATLEDVRSFYRTWYTPSNATLALAGDFEVASARKLIEQWFGSFPVTAKPAPRLPPNPSGKQVRKEIVDPLVKLRKIEYLWTSPQALQPGDAEFDILAHALGNTGTGRLYKLLVHEKQLAQEVEVEQRSAQFGSVLSVAVTLKSDADLAAVESLLDAQVDEVMKEPISEAEFRRAVTEREADYIWGLESLLARVETLQYYNHVWGDPTGAVSRDLDRYRKSTPEQVRATAARHLSRTNRVEILTLPGDGSHAGK
jgi:zinc protease